MKGRSVTDFPGTDASRASFLPEIRISLAYVLLDAGDAPPLVSAAVAFSVCAGLRLAAIRWNLSLPAYGGGRMS